MNCNQSWDTRLEQDPTSLIVLSHEAGKRLGSTYLWWSITRIILWVKSDNSGTTLLWSTSTIFNRSSLLISFNSSISSCKNSSWSVVTPTDVRAWATRIEIFKVFVAKGKISNLWLQSSAWNGISDSVKRASATYPQSRSLDQRTIGRGHSKLKKTCFRIVKWKINTDPNLNPRLHYRHT